MSLNRLAPELFSLPYFSVVEPNPNGRDFQLGDIHGNLCVLNAALAKLEENDRLFLVGDLIDRGPNSVEILKLVMKIQDETPGKVFITAGNHEMNFKLSLDALLYFIDHYIDDGKNKKPVSEEIEKSPDYRRACQDIHDIYAFKSGWIINLFKEELAKGLIVLQNDIPYMLAESFLSRIEDFVVELPNITLVAGDKKRAPYFVVHSDLPISDHFLKQPVALTPADLNYSINAREFSSSGVSPCFKKGPAYLLRHPESIISFCGHSPMSDKKQRPVRSDTNSVNLDVDAWRTSVAVLFCVTDGTCELIGDKEHVLEASRHPDFLKVLTQYQLAGKKQQLVQAMYVELQTCETEAEQEAVIRATARKMEQAPWMMMLPWADEKSGDKYSHLKRYAEAVGVFGKQPAPLAAPGTMGLFPPVEKTPEENPLTPPPKP